MILTEKEAATKRCQESFGDRNVSPNGQALFAGGAMGGAFAVNTSPSFCMGSLCMAWRIAEAAKPADPGRVIGRNLATGELFYEKGTQKPEIPAKGYCGKAGKPR